MSCAQLAARGLDRVGGWGRFPRLWGRRGLVPRGRGALGRAWTGLGPLPRRHRLGVAGPGSDSAKSSKAPGRLLAQRGVDEPPAAVAFLVVPCRGADRNGGADWWCPRRPMGTGLGPGGHGPGVFNCLCIPLI
ncbi:hypothetical protein HMPREF1550_01889 [Actinomyces sp. oral taxon 877 str. F0543]|nr:hypothetical protein HMPREF1550_01889 [Actinomyces sp. oral taxon 877 str. F0543]